MIEKLGNKWTAWFKFVLIIIPVCLPFAVGWSVWVTSSAFNSKYHSVSAREIRISDEALHDDIKTNFKEVGKEIEEVKQQQLQADQDNRTDHTAILVSLESLKTKIDLIRQ